MATNHNCREDSVFARSVRRHGRFRGWTGLVAVMLLGATSFASAQRYQADVVDEKAGILKLTAEQCVKNPSRFAADRDRFVQFFDTYYFPAMTRFAADDLAQLGRMREDLFNRFLWASTDEKLQGALTDMAFNKMQPIVRSSKYHPAVRYNAILVLGMLDEAYATQGRPPVPLGKATGELNLIVDYAAQGKPVPPFLVVGALVGLRRYALYDDKLDPATIEAMSAAVLKFAAKDGTLPEVDSKVAEWMRIQAATVLANLGSPGSNGEALAAMTKMIAGKTDPKMSLDARCQVAALLKQMNYNGAKIDGQALSEALLQLALAVGKSEAKEAEAFEEMQIQGGGYGGAPRSKGRMRFDPETSQWEFDARVLLARLGDLRTGLNAAKTVVPADKQPVFEVVLAAIRPAVAAAESTDTIDLEVADKVGKMAEAIRSALQPGSAPAEEADASDVF